MNPETLDASLSTFILWTIKSLGLAILILYLFFSLIVVRQVQMMNRVLKTQISRQLKIVALIHAGIGVITFLIFLVVL